MLWQDEMLNYELFFYINKANHTNNHWPRWLYVYIDICYNKMRCQLLIVYVMNIYALIIYMYVPTCQCLKCE